MPNQVNPPIGIIGKKAWNILTKLEGTKKMSNPKEECKDDWHLSWKNLCKKYGSAEEADKHYNYAMTCPTCGEKRIL
jgi:hypothetical protein